MRDLCQFLVACPVRQFVAANLGVFRNAFASSIGRIVCFVCALVSASVAVDLEKGKEINGTCAACHSDNGQGGKKGEYPRIAGQQVKYLENQLKSFRARTRVNIPMFPYTQEREMSDADVKDIAAYLNGIELDTQMPTYTGKEDALTKLLMAEKVMIIPRAEGDLEAGGKIYQKQCASCHAKSGRGRGMFPMLVGQYTNYLKRQVDLYRAGDRAHDEEAVGGVLNTLDEKQIQDVLAYLTSIQDPKE
ncbi:MAG: c-type cytochrome [Dechloromonas sp.]|uniref:C-type cytochrome n=1 Tax=Candidatus Dechloromonas phosphorivorans TaxID=2899244 RepID=A0A935JX09_9RHOO|nr:c-type cytochrome [Candidatus Dechloromonas phosphorivorans]